MRVWFLYAAFVAVLALSVTSGEELGSGSGSGSGSGDSTIEGRHGNCSMSAVIVCAEFATCEDLPDHNFRCVCFDGVGDGYRDGTGCKPNRLPCTDNSTCTEGFCNMDDETFFFCQCSSGFTGNGMNCTDVDECLEEPCHTWATCHNTLGSYDCTCRKGFFGNGTYCEHICYTDFDCAENAKCGENKHCFCPDKWFRGNGVDACDDVDECTEGTHNCHGNAVCVNEVGNYTCKCDHGYTGNGRQCEALPKDCEEIRQKRPSSQNGIYTIDADGTGTIPEFDVMCEFKDGVGITIVYPDQSYPKPSPSGGGTDKVPYEPTPEQLGALANISKYCTQDVWLECKSGFKLQSKVEWCDVRGVCYRTWGGATNDGECACGQINYCQGTSSCNCDGSGDTREDVGTIIDKNQLPVAQVKFTPQAGSASYSIGKLQCGPKPPVLPKDCHEAKYDPRWKVRKNGPLLIDVDGQDGPLPPTLVYCDMTSYDHVGVTVIPHDITGPIEPDSTSTTSLPYLVPGPVVEGLIKLSAFCSQEIRVDCKNSRLMNGGNRKGYVTVGSNNRTLPYFPGAQGVENSCACGLTKSCDLPNFKCNCDITDGKERTELGVIIDKNDLPIVSVTVEKEGANSSAKVKVGNLMCSQNQFAIEPNCEKYRATGSETSYSYLIDPDGPKPVGSTAPNAPPFLVECVFQTEPALGITIVHHNQSQMTVGADDVFTVAYLRVVDDLQILKLLERSTYCVQSVNISCKGFPLSEGGTAAVYTSIQGGEYKIGDEVCPNGTCLCDQKLLSFAYDQADLTNKSRLPMRVVDFSDIKDTLENVAQAALSVNLGPLKCYETFPTCAQMWMYMNDGTGRVLGESKPEPGRYTIDPDGASGVEPFQVWCWQSFTEIPVSKPDLPAGPPNQNGVDPISVCYDIKYKDSNDNPISTAQISALVKNSKMCSQTLDLDCLNAPITNHINYTTCHGVTQQGWAGSENQPQCACGVAGMCTNNKPCDCDNEDNIKRREGGIIRTTDQLPVCQVCITLDGLPGDGSGPPSRSAAFTISRLLCTDYSFGVPGSCQGELLSPKNDPGSRLIYVEPDIPGLYDPPTPVWCEVIPYPNTALTMLRPKNDTVTVPPNQEFDIEIKYYVINFDSVVKILEKTKFCEQELWLDCNDGALQLGAGKYGWYSRGGTLQTYWAGSPNASVPCKGNKGLCNCNLAGIQTDGGTIGRKDLLPVSRVVLPPASTPRTLHIGPVKCYELHKDCQAILDAGQTRQTPYTHNSSYVIDPDGAGGVPMMVVECDFDEKNNIGTTIVPSKRPGNWTGTVTGADGPGEAEFPFSFPTATPEQINALTKESGFCYQGVEFRCKETPLLNGNSPAQSFLRVGLDDDKIPSFGTGFNTNAVGCPCGQLGSCGTNTSCRCDARGPMVAVDQGKITDPAALPVTAVQVGGQNSPSATVTVDVSNIFCAPKPHPDKFPKDCEDAYKKNFKTGEVMVFPDGATGPFFVYCNMDLVPGTGVLEVFPNTTPETPLTPNNKTDVPWKGPTPEQLALIVSAHLHCYLPVRLNCYKTKFLAGQTSYWQGMSGQGGINTYWGTGNVGSECTCGADNLCGGTDGYGAMSQRKCNCDVGDAKWRVDAGIISVKGDLPIRRIFLGTQAAGAKANITMGKLYCANEPFDLNECTLGFHDCDPRAQCLNKDGTKGGAGFACRCPVGWDGRVAGKTRDDIWANGRECVDTDECSFKPCPHSADCINNPGSFECKCKPGYTQTSPLTCQDINECQTGQHNCDENARCENTLGSFRCVCKLGYRGEGTVGTCKPMGMCSCFGDPHCLSFDNRWLHFMGECQYVMAKDGCDGATPTFQVLTTNWDQNKDLPVTWVKEVTVLFDNYTIWLRQGREVRIDGVKVGPVSFRPGLMIVNNGREVVLKTSSQIEIRWNGKDRVDVQLPAAFREKTCGICGNYNGEMNDDWELGKRCSEESAQAANAVEFGNSWVAESWLVNQPQCGAPCDAPDENVTEECGPEMRRLVEHRCDLILGSESPFKACLQEMQATEPTMVENFRLSCVTDACLTEDLMSVCYVAETVVKICQSQMGFQFENWRSAGMCSPECGENMSFRTCQPGSNSSSIVERTCAEARGAEPVAAGELKCEEACYCKEGYYRDGDKCLPEVDCGCYMADNSTYMQKGQVIALSGCGGQIVCGEDGQIREDRLECDENAECKLDDGVYGCHCKEGYMGDGTVCEVDPCGGVQCETNQECVNGTCQCLQGFMGGVNVDGKCTNCADIDECATRTDDCDHIGQICVNTNGSYVCKCAEGYASYGEYCEDINECDIQKDLCGAHAECVNLPGSYVCGCCAGFKKQGAECVPDPTQSASGEKCCSCVGERCVNEGKVCGKDGKTYPNEKSLIIDACLRNDTENEVDYPGQCEPDCSSVVCDQPFMQCVVNPATGKATCKCPDCSGPNTPPPTGPVCSTKNVLYRSECEFQATMCAISDSETKLTENPDDCMPGGGSEPVTPWGEWSECSNPCGQGTVTRSREAVRDLTPIQRSALQLDQTAVCYSTCPEGPCYNTTCTGNGQVCYVADDNSARCRCPDCTGRGQDPVCGLVGNVIKTFVNSCELKKTACQTNRPFEQITDYACEAKPVNCTKYGRFERRREGECVSGVVDWGTCAGGCGVLPNKCCQPETFETVPDVFFRCDNGTTYNAQIRRVSTCRCVSEEELASTTPGQ